MQAKKALIIAIEANPEFSRFYYVCKTELLHIANKGKTQIKINILDKTTESVEVVSRALNYEGYKTEKTSDFLTIKF